MMLDCVPRCLLRIGMAGLLVIGSLATARAQSLNATVRQPDMRIMADHLFVGDHRKLAIFSGNVRLVQGERQLNCARLLVKYLALADGGKSSIDQVTCDGEVIWDRSWFQLR